MKVTVLLRNEHETLKSLFNRFDKPPNGRGKKDLFMDIQRELLIHSQVEQEIFYPALSATASERAVELVSTAEREHQHVEKLLEELSAMNGSEKNFETKVHELMDEVSRHIDMEEDQIFEEARNNLPEYRLEELGLEMEDRRKILTTLAA